MKLKGNDLIVFFEQNGAWKTLAYATTCEIDIQAGTINVGSPNTGKWEMKKKRRMSWRVSCGHLLSDTAQDIDFFKLLTNNIPVMVNMASVLPHLNPVFPNDYVPDRRISVKGYALLTRVTITGRRGDACTLSLELDGCGELNMYTSGWILDYGHWNMSGCWYDDGVWNFN